MIARLGQVIGWAVAGSAIILSSAAIFLLVTSTQPIVKAHEHTTLFVSWFFLNQQPLHYERDFLSYDDCQATMNETLYEETRLRQESDERDKKDQARGITRGTVPTPVVSAICSIKK